MLIFSNLDLDLPPEMTPLPPLLTIARSRAWLDDEEDLESVAETIAREKPELVLFLTADLVGDDDLANPEEGDEAYEAYFGAAWLSDGASLVFVEDDHVPDEDEDEDDEFMDDEDDDRSCGGATRCRGAEPPRRRSALAPGPESHCLTDPLNPLETIPT